ncbi:MAG: EAL domain-containing protein [Candidatus Limnocylindrales bacterium]
MAVLDWNGEVRAETDSAGVASVRRRVVVALAIIFVAQVVLWTLLGDLESGEGEVDPFIALLRVVVIGGALPLLMVVLARAILAPAERLEAARDHFRQEYDRARLTALLDPLTGLGNHRAFQEELARLVADAQRAKAPLALLLVDLDDLKRINDERGHAGGDAALATMGRLLMTSMRHADRAFRIGGDEFAILMPNTDAIGALAIARRLLVAAVETAALEPSDAIEVSDARQRQDAHDAPRAGAPETPDDRVPPELSFSGGIASLAPETGDSGQLFRQADAALYWCKRHGRTDVQIFDPQRHGAAGDARTTPELAAAVAAVADRRLLRPVYQPIYSLATGKPIGFEGLVRPLPGSGFADPNSLFMAAEVIGRTVELDMASIAVVASHARDLGADQYLAANLSPRTLETDQFHAADLVAIFREHGIEPSRVVLELTERETVDDMSRLRESIAACRAAGFRLAADDVGAGNAGLRLLSQVRFDIVKIDLSLVQVGVLEESSRAVLRALRDLADRWSATIVAEGVETPSQLEVVHGLGIAAVQGYLLGRPGDRPRADDVDVDMLIGSVRWRSDLLPVPEEAEEDEAAVGSFG